MTPIAALILELMSPMRNPQLAFALAPVIVAAAKTGPVDPRVLASVIFAESSFRADVIGKRGEVGLAQIHPINRELCADLWPRIMQPAENLTCAVRVMMDAQHRCKTADPAVWLSKYNAQPCAPSRYAKRVMGRIGGAS